MTKLRKAYSKQAQRKEDAGEAFSQRRTKIRDDLWNDFEEETRVGRDDVDTLLPNRRRYNEED